MTLYDNIAAALLPVLPSFSVDGTLAWTVIRSTGALERTPAVEGQITAYVVRNKVDAALAALPQTTIYTAPWLLFGELGMDLLADDIVTDGDTRTFLVAGEPQTDFAMVFAPLTPTQLPIELAAGGFASPLPWLGMGA